MASFSAAPHKLKFSNAHKFLHVKRPFYPRPSLPSAFPDSVTLCRCSSSDNNANHRRRWDLAIQDALKNALKRFDSYMKDVAEKKKEEEGRENDGVLKSENGVEEWDWDRWKRHFEEVDEQERLVSILKSQLGNAVYKEEYEDAARLKVASAAAATNDTVGRVMLNLNRAVMEERYEDAALLRDKAGAGLVGWWVGISEDKKDPYGLIIRVTAEHGRYVARSYSPWQLATAAVGVPIFEIFLTVNKKGEYKQQAVYLKRRGVFEDYSMMSSKVSGATSPLNPSGSTEDKDDLLVVNTEDAKDSDETDDGSDLAEGLSHFQDMLRDMIPGVKVNVLKVTTPGKVDQDFILKVIEQIMNKEDEDKDIEVENVESEDKAKHESDTERNEIEMDTDHGIIENEERSEMSVKVVVGSFVQKLPGSMPAKEFLRLPAKVEKKGHLSFSFSIEKETKQRDSNAKDLTSVGSKSKHQTEQSIESVMLDLAKFISREKIPMKVLKDLGEVINLSLSQAQNCQPLSGSTTFRHIDIAASPDPLNGLYIGAHGLYTSEVIHLSHKVGQWQDDGGTRNLSNLEFYEYVEAIKVTGDPYIPAGQYIKGGPVVGFVYWAPEYHILVFFNRLRLQ